MSLQKLFYPQGVAVIGSVSRGKLGYQLVRQLVDGGYSRVYAVNPAGKGVPAGRMVPVGTGVPAGRGLPVGRGVADVPGFKAVTEIGQTVDLAVIVSPTGTVPAVLEDCGRAGIGAAVIITAGFSEAGNEAGEEAVAQAARRHGIRFVGPNCAGIVNTRHNLAPTLETLPPAGGVSLIAQSGAVGGVVLAWAKEFGLGISKFVSFGNGADLREVELLRYLAEDPDTEVVALYTESVSDGRAFMEAVRECMRRKPLVVIKSGRTESGQRATLSHTGSMAGADAVYDAALRQCGAIRVHSVEELFDACKAFATLPPLAGDRVVIVTNSGGPGVMAADRAEELGLVLDEPSPSARARLAEFLPPQCALKNPVDLTVEGTEDGYRQALLALVEEYDAALALNIAPAYLDSVPLARGVCDAAELSGRPVAAAFLPAQIVKEALPCLEARGVPNFATGERAVSALRHMARHQAQREIWRPLAAAEAERGGLPGTGQLLEHEAMAWLKAEGFPVPENRFAPTLEEALQACGEIGYPVAMKVVSPEIVHKSDVGGVALDLQDGAAAAAAFARLQQVAAGRDFRGVVLYPMIGGRGEFYREVLLGLSRDPQFGPVVAFGLGGVYTEVWQDISLRVAPVDRQEAGIMIREIRSLPLLQGARGQPPCDLGALADLLAEFSQLPFRYPEIDQVDLNPVFLFSARLVVGDVRVFKREG
jgi:acyl-CoA synthetase (NDP forming)